MATKPPFLPSRFLKMQNTVVELAETKTLLDFWCAYGKLHIVGTAWLHSTDAGVK